MPDSLEAVYADIQVDPSLARCRRHADLHWPFGSADGCEAVLLVDHPKDITLQEWEVFNMVCKGYMTFVMKYGGRWGSVEWVAMKALTARELRLLRPRVWVARGQRSARMLGVLPVAQDAFYASRTPKGVPVLQGPLDQVLLRLPLVVNDPEEFLPSD